MNLPVSAHVLAVPLRAAVATVVNVPTGMTAMRFACPQDAWMLLGSELAEVPAGPINDGTASALLQGGRGHVREVVAGQRLSFIVAGPDVLASVEFF